MRALIGISEGSNSSINSPYPFWEAGMFREAYKIASEFTLPVIVSRKNVDGKCLSSLAAAVVVNDEGWVITAYHVLQGFQAMHDEALSVKAAIDQKAGINADASLSGGEKKRRLASVPQPKAAAAEKCSISFGGVQTTIKNWVGVEAVDVAVAKLEPWDSKWIKKYPKFKDHTKGLDHGTSLCKLGFPFHGFTPTFDEATNSFMLPPEAMPIPRFPIEGIFTRTVEIQVAGGEEPVIPLRWLETSSPGLKGQSGGPTFDRHGTVWAIQARTLPIHLGFDGETRKPPQRIPQFLNVGLGVHPESIFATLKAQGIKFEISDY